MTPTLAAHLEAERDKLASFEDGVQRLAPSVFPITDSAIELLATLPRRYIRPEPPTEAAAALQRFREAGNVTEADAAELLASATLIGAPEGDDPAERAKRGFREAEAPNVLTFLLLRLQRDLLFAVSDALRTRLSTATGHLRLQVESVALCKLIVDTPEIAAEWFRCWTSDQGRDFHRRHHRAIRKAMEDLNLYQTFAFASLALHPRMWGMGKSMRLESERDGELIHTTSNFDSTETDNGFDAVLVIAGILRRQELIALAAAQAFDPDSTSTETAKDVESLHLRVNELFALLRSAKHPGAAAGNG